MVWSSCGILYIRCDFLHFYPRKERFATKYIFQFARILAFCFLGEILHCVLPLPVPASVYGLMLLLAALRFGVVKLEQVRTAALFLIGIKNPLAHRGPPYIKVINDVALFYHVRNWRTRGRGKIKRSHAYMTPSIIQ